ncbi:MAG: potassium transporter TrkG [Nonlabens sp.]
MLGIIRKYNKFLLKLSPQRNLVYGFLAYNLVGFLLLCLPIARVGELSVIDSLFAATSAISTTGLLTVGIQDYFSTFGHVVLLAMFQVGGIGYMTFTTYILLNTSRKSGLWRQKILKAAFSLPEKMKIRDFLRSVIVFTIVMELVGTILFYIAFRNEGWGFWQTLWNSLFHSVSAFCTAGFSLFGNGFTDYVSNGLINFTICLLAIGGSLGFIVVTDLWLIIAKRKHKMSFTTKVIFFGFLILLTFGTLSLYFDEPTIIALNGAARFYAAFFQTMTAMTTVGFNTMDIGALSLPVLFTIIFLMYVGASPSGTSGGLKITTFTAVIAYLRSTLKASEEVRFLGRYIPAERVSIALSTFIFYIGIVFAGILLLTHSEDFALTKIMFEVLSALGTVGLSMGITGDLTLFGKIVVILLMFIGRLGVLTFGLALSTGYDNTKEALSVDIAV